MKESAGSTKYFRFAKEMKYPRLRLAIEHNHKDFVGHMYCQQVLRQEWHGGIKWQGAGLLFKIIYTLLQIPLAIVYVLAFLILDVSRTSKFIPKNRAISDFHKMGFLEKLVKRCEKLTVGIFKSIYV